AQVTREVEGLGAVGIATVLVGDDPASHLYIGMKHRAAEAAGMRALDHRLPAETSQEEILELVRGLNADEGVDGILVQLPLPPHVDEAVVVRSIQPVKDVDGLTPFNAGALFLGTPTLVPATPLGCMALLVEHNVPLEGRR